MNFFKDFNFPQSSQYFHSQQTIRKLLFTFTIPFFWDPQLHHSIVTFFSCRRRLHSHPTVMLASSSLKLICSIYTVITYILHILVSVWMLWITRRLPFDTLAFTRTHSSIKMVNQCRVPCQNRWMMLPAMECWSSRSTPLPLPHFQLAHFRRRLPLPPLSPLFGYMQNVFPFACFDWNYAVFLVVLFGLCVCA